jgi:hypothetical protein
MDWARRSPEYVRPSSTFSYTVGQASYHYVVAIVRPCVNNPIHSHAMSCFVAQRPKASSHTAVLNCEGTFRWSGREIPLAGRKVGHPPRAVPGLAAPTLRVLRRGSIVTRARKTRLDRVPLPRPPTLSWGHSKACPGQKKTLPWYSSPPATDNIPILLFLPLSQR